MGIVNEWKPVLRRVPGLASTYRLTKFLSRSAYLRWWLDGQARADRAYRLGLWKYDLPRVLERYRLVLSAVGSRLGAETWGDALEMGCAEGAFTVELAPRCRSVTACDISPVACARAAERCAHYSNVRVQQLNVIREPVAGKYDMAFLMEVLEAIRGRKQIEEVVGKMAGALRSGGILVFCDYRLPPAIRSDWWSRWILEGGDNLAAFIGSNFGLQLVHQEIYAGGQGIPEYTGHVIALFEKCSEPAVNRDGEAG